ncbi:hypothetical protein [Methanococcus maripaludis]|uniref:Uncharacterized protein n=1 Tax=Methanococcus maripaludis TaxID=39152 RepID=A0A7J9PGZ8_METMI|nr:hypothetical protein [Methanococcus maripaludis]MBA2862492.1 hypothetical protein [Methanococcus maripaludis]
MSITEIFELIVNLYSLLFEQVFGHCGVYYPLFVSGIVSISVFFIFRGPNKSIIALIITALIIMAFSVTPYACKLVALVLVAVFSVFFL